MSSIVDGWRNVQVNGSAREISKVPLGELVEVAALLRGQLMPAGLEWDRPPLALRIALEGSIATFCFSSNDFERCLWGSTQTLAGGLLDIEEALCRAHCDWRKNKWYKQVFTQGRR